MDTTHGSSNSANTASPTLTPSSSSQNDNGVPLSSSQPSAKQVTSPFNIPEGSPLSQLANNPFFTAGFGLAALGAVAAVARKGSKHGFDFVRRRMLVSVEVTAKDESYPWILQWMSTHQRRQLAQQQERRIPLEPSPGRAKPRSILDRIVPRLHHLQIQTSKVHRPDGSSRTHFALVPGPGRNIFRYESAFIMVNRQREKEVDMSGNPFETITMTTLYSQRHVFEQLFTEAHQLAKQRTEGKTVIYTSWGTEWKEYGLPKRKRPLESVVLEEGTSERILDDLHAFIAARTWYLDRGIPYRRGYLLHGPPGTGKSSFIQALAGELDFNIGLLNLSERGLTDDRLNHLLTRVPPRTILLLEDADAAFVNRRAVDSDGYSGASVTFSGLLNALDGVGSAEERIIFMTTNHIERLDDALIRPGRIDVMVRIGLATAWQMGQLWNRFYGEKDVSGAGKQAFVRQAAALGLVDRVSTAALQGLFLQHKDDAMGAITRANQLLGAGPRVESRQQEGGAAHGVGK